VRKACRSPPRHLASALSRALDRSRAAPKFSNRHRCVRLSLPSQPRNEHAARNVSHPTPHSHIASLHCDPHIFAATARAREQLGPKRPQRGHNARPSHPYGPRQEAEHTHHSTPHRVDDLRSPHRVAPRRRIQQAATPFERSPRTVRDPHLSLSRDTHTHASHAEPHEPPPARGQGRAPSYEKATDGGERVRTRTPCCSMGRASYAPRPLLANA
jgi:hypothetical protein